MAVRRSHPAVHDALPLCRAPKRFDGSEAWIRDTGSNSQWQPNDTGDIRRLAEHHARGQAAAGNPSQR